MREDFIKEIFILIQQIQMVTFHLEKYVRNIKMKGMIFYVFLNIRQPLVKTSKCLVIISALRITKIGQNYFLRFFVIVVRNDR